MENYSIMKRFNDKNQNISVFSYKMKYYVMI